MNCFNACIDTNMQLFTAAWNTGEEGTWIEIGKSRV